MSSKFTLQNIDDILFDNPFGAYQSENFQLANINARTKNEVEQQTYLQKWSIEENRIYMNYLLKYPQDFESQASRRKSKVFKRLSQQMGGRRDAEQCRGHHKKMATKYKGPQQIVKALQIKMEKTKKKQGLRKQREFRREIRKEKNKIKKLQSQQRINQLQMTDKEMFEPFPFEAESQEHNCSLISCSLADFLNFI